MSQPRPKPPCQAARSWLQIRRGRQCLAPLTGSTSRIFSAYLHLAEAWIATMDPRLIEPLRSTVALLQRAEWPLAAEAIAHFGDWSHIPQLWSQIRPPGAPMYKFDPVLDGVYAVLEDADKAEVR